MHPNLQHLLLLLYMAAGCRIYGWMIFDIRRHLNGWRTLTTKHAGWNLRVQHVHLIHYHTCSPKQTPYSLIHFPNNCTFPAHSCSIKLITHFSPSLVHFVGVEVFRLVCVLWLPWSYTIPCRRRASKKSTVIRSSQQRAFMVLLDMMAYYH